MTAVAAVKREAKIADMAANEMARHCDLRIKKSRARIARAEALLAEALCILKPNNRALEKRISKFITEKFDV